MRAGTLRYLCIVLSTLSTWLAACASRERVAVVGSAEVERKLAVEACVTVERTLGADKAKALLVGHVIRPGKRTVLVVRELDETGALPIRRLTLAIDEDDAGDLALPSPRATLRADRTSRDGSDVRDLTLRDGRLRLRRVAREVWEVELTIHFADAGEEALWVSRTVGERAFDDTTPREGRSNPYAVPAEFTGFGPPTQRSSAAGVPSVSAPLGVITTMSSSRTPSSPGM